jgi:hypothetical protein
MIYVYAIGERQEKLVAFVRRGVERPPAPDETNLREHDQTVAELMAAHDAVLPMRFGTVVETEHDVRELLARRGEELRGQLAHVRGRVEIGVRAPWDGGPIVAHSGGEFMRAKAERRAAARRAAAAVHEPLSELAVDSVLRLNPREDTMFSAAYLVEREEAGEFADEARRLATVTGPWPPYSFSG